MYTIGWRFIRIRGSEYYRDTEKTIERVIKNLSVFGIEPEDSSALPTNGRTSELFRRVKSQAELALLKEKESMNDVIEETVAAALDPMAIINDQPECKNDFITVGDFTEIFSQNP